MNLNSRSPTLNHNVKTLNVETLERLYVTTFRPPTQPQEKPQITQIDADPTRPPNRTQRRKGAKAQRRNASSEAGEKGRGARAQGVRGAHPTCLVFSKCHSERSRRRSRGICGETEGDDYQVALSASICVISGQIHGWVGGFASSRLCVEYLGWAVGIENSKFEIENSAFCYCRS